MLTLQRQQLVTLKPEAWPLLLSMAEGHDAQTALAHWAENSLPLVVTRQPACTQRLTQQVGLPLPLCWGRQRLSLTVLHTQVAQLSSFPAASDALPLLCASERAAWHGLFKQMVDLGVMVRVYGSHGWQLLTGLNYLRAGSDLDLLLQLPVADATAAAHMADAVAELLIHFAIQRPRLDGELVFAGDAAVAWREWRRWRALRSGSGGAILVKRTRGLALETGYQWCAPLAGPDPVLRP